MILLLLGYSLCLLAIGYYCGHSDASDRLPYHVKYIQNCSSMKIKKFKTREEAAKWVANFKLKYQGTRIEPDCWVDLVFQGDVVYED